MDLNELKEIKEAKGKLVNTRRFYKKERQPGDFAEVWVYSNPTVYNIALLEFKNFKTCDRVGEEKGRRLGNLIQHCQKEPPQRL